MEDCRWKIVVIDRVRVMLRFQGKCIVLGVYNTFLAGDRSIQEIAAIELYSWLCCPNLHVSSRHGFIHLGRFGEHVVWMVQAEIVVVPDRRASHGDQIAANGFGTGKIQRRSLNGGDLSGWD